MNDYWSTYVQYTEELYRSRALKFHDGNKDLWLTALRVEDGMNILEVGCGGGIFCHRIKTYLPNTQVTGLDYDTGHIAYAKEKTAQLGLDCRFIGGDAVNLPFDDGTFDLCFSHTVMNFCEPEAFVREQYRVLKPGGIMVILNVVGGGVNSEMWKPDENSAEKELFDRLWAEAEKNELSQIKKFDLSLRDYPIYLEKAGFVGVRLEVVATAAYNPDSSHIGREESLQQINENRLSELCSVQKAKAIAPSALSDNEFGELLRLINRRYDERIEKYMVGEKVWDFSAGMTLAVSGSKES